MAPVQFGHLQLEKEQAMSDKLQHVLETQQFPPEILMEVLERAEAMKIYAGNDPSKGEFHSSFGQYDQKIMATLFYEPSTRTRLSFESAMHHMGGRVISTENAREFSSAAKGETLEDTIRTVGCYADVIVLRHFESGAAKRAARVSSVPIINAGDGAGQHPTQALLDAFTIMGQFGRLDHLVIVMVGDLANGRTVRSLIYLLSKFTGNQFVFVAPDAVRMRDDILEYLSLHKVSYCEMPDLLQAVSLADVLYVTRIQKERFGDNVEAYESAFGKYIVDNEIADAMPDRGIIMHPLPRVNELLAEVDRNPRARYFQQVENGLYVRMALLEMVLQ